ncbi:unnamed protein product, partial [Staurois parvus]
SGNRRQSTPGQGLGQQAAIYPWAGASGNRRQSTPGQGSRGLNGTLAVKSGLSTAPTQLLGTLGSRGLNGAVHNNPGGLCAQQGQFLDTGGRCTQLGSSEHGWSVHTAGTVQDTSGRCTHRGQFRTRVVSAHSGDSSEHGWSVHTAGAVQDTGGQCTQQGQFRTQVVGAHKQGQFSGRGWSVRT